MGKEKKPFPVRMFVDEREAESNVRWLQLELFERGKGGRAREDIERGSLSVRAHPNGRPAPDCLEITAKSYAEGKATFKAAVKRDFIQNRDFLSLIREPILYAVEVRAKSGRRSRARPAPVMRLLDIRVAVAALHWKWWGIAPGEIPETAPPNAQRDTAIRLDPDGVGGFGLELWVRQFNASTGEFENFHGGHDFAHRLSPGAEGMSFAEVAPLPLPWESEDPRQELTNWWSMKEISTAAGNFPESGGGAIRVSAFPKGAIRRRFAHPPFITAIEPRVAARDIPLRLDSFAFELVAINGQSPEKMIPLPAAEGLIPDGGYKLTLKLFNGDEEAAGIGVAVTIGNGGGKGAGAFGRILGAGGEGFKTREDGTFDFLYKPDGLVLAPRHIEARQEIEERFHIVARRHERCKGHTVFERAGSSDGARGKAEGACSLAIALEPQLRLHFYKKPFIFDDRDPGGAKPGGPGAAPSTGERTAALEPYRVELEAEMLDEDRARLREIIRRGGEFHLKAGIDYPRADAPRRILDGSWFLGDFEGAALRKVDDWLDGDSKEVCVMRFPGTGHPDGPVTTPLVFERKGGFRMIRPVERALNQIEERAGKVDEGLGTGVIAARARGFVAYCVKRIGGRDERELDGEARSFIETIATVSHFLWSTKLCNDALEASLGVHDMAWQRFRENIIGGFFDILSFGPIGDAIAGFLRRGGDKVPTAHISRLVADYLANGKESALRLARELAREIPKDAGAAAEALLRAERNAIEAAVALLREPADAAGRSLTLKTGVLREIALAIAPLREAKHSQGERLDKLRDELPVLAKAESAAKADLERISAGIRELRDNLARVARDQEREARTLQGLEKSAKRLAEIEGVAAQEASELAATLQVKLEETASAKAARDAASARLEDLKKIQEGLVAAESGAKVLADARSAELSRIDTAIGNCRRAREAAVGRKEGLELKLADRRAGTATAEREAGSASMRAQRATEIVAEKSVGRDALETGRTRLAAEFAAYQAGEEDARGALAAETEKLARLKAESPPDQQAIRVIEKERVARSREYEKARDEMEEHRLRVERAAKAVEDAGRTIAGFLEREQEAVRVADEKNETHARMKRLEEEQAALVDQNSAEIERLRGELESLEKAMAGAAQAKEAADADLAAKADAVKGNAVAVETAQAEFTGAHEAWKKLDGERSALRGRHGIAARRFDSAKSQADSAQRKVADSEERLRRLAQEEGILRDREKNDLVEEAEARRRHEGAAEALASHEGLLLRTSEELAGTGRQLDPLEERLPAELDAWKASRAAEEEAARELSRRVLEAGNLAQWNERLDHLRDALDLILRGGGAEGLKEITARFDDLADSAPEGRRRTMLEEQARGMIESRMKEMEQWTATLASLPDGAKAVIAADELVSSWEEHRLLESKATLARLSEMGEELWASLDAKVKEGQKGADIDMAGALEEARRGSPPPGSGEFHEKSASPWAGCMEAFDHAIFWTLKARRASWWALDWLVPDFLSSLFMNVVLAGYVEALSWLHGFLNWLGDKLLGLVRSPEFFDKSALPPGARSQARSYIDAGGLCDPEFFRFEARCEADLVGNLKPESVLEKAKSPNALAALKEEVRAAAVEGYHDYFQSQRRRAAAMFERLCLKALDLGRIERCEPIECLGQRRQATQLVGNLARQMKACSEAVLPPEGGKVSIDGLLAPAERGEWNAKGWNSVLDWAGWLISWALRTGALVAIPFASGLPASALAADAVIEGTCACLRTACSVLFNYPRIIAFQHDLLLAHSLAYQAYFEKYELSETDLLVEGAADARRGE